MKKLFNRRNFIKTAAITALSIEFAYLIFDVFKNKNIDNNTANLFSAGKVNKFENNMMYAFSSEKFHLSVLEDGGMLAISVKCTHLGCIVQVNKDGFLCPCHASAFNKLGEVLSPPAVRALDIFPIKIENGEIKVDTNNPIKRKVYDKSQLTYA